MDELLISARRAAAVVGLRRRRAARLRRDRADHRPGRCRARSTLLLVGFLAYAGHAAARVRRVVMIGGRAGRRRAGLRRGAAARPAAARRAGWGSGSARSAGPEADAMLDRHGGRASSSARLVAFARTLMPRLAGDGRHAVPPRFAPWNVLGVIIQVAGSVALGYLAGGSYELVAELLGRATGALLAARLVIVGLIVSRALPRRNHPDPVTAFGDRIGAWGPLRLLDRGLRRAVPLAHHARRRRAGGRGQRAARRRPCCSGSAPA